MSQGLRDEIRPEPLSKALSERYLAYALSTITQRALPDARDGLKPVHRRILWAMRLLNLDPQSGFKKCARVVGDAMGKFHPHGEGSIYDALVRLAQEFAVRYPLVEGQGNFGNVDGDGAAAMRYTECRLTEGAQSLLEGVDENAVDLRSTYSGEDDEPIVLPAAFPNLLANGSSGIAVGMATSVPPHNLGELCAALVTLIANPNARDSTLSKHVRGPDFPTGGIIVDEPSTIAEAYRTGRGSFRLRARWLKEDLGRGVYALVVDQIPYQVQKAKLIEQMAELMEQKKLPLLGEVRDESAEDVRVVLVPKSRAVEPEVLMEQLFRNTDLETRIPLNMNVLDAGLIPRVMSLKEALQAYINHRREVLERRSRFRLEKIASRLNVLEGYLAVYLNLDRVIKIIRNEDNPKPLLMKAFKLDENQAEAILNMRLRSLRKLEEREIRSEHAKLSEEKKTLERLLRSDQLMRDRLIEEVKDVDRRFGAKTGLGKRRTQFSAAPDVADDAAAIELLVERESITVACSEKGWIRAFKGHQEFDASVKHREADQGRFWLPAETTDKLMVFSSDGRFFTLQCSDLPGGRGLGEPIRSFIDLPPDAEIVSLFVHRPGRKLLIASSGGHGFVTNEDDAVALTKSGKRVMNLAGSARAKTCAFVNGDSTAVIGENRKLVIFPLDQVPELGRGRGVILQRYKDGGLLDASVFAWKDGLRDANNRTWSSVEMSDWKGARAQAGRLAPRGWAKSGLFGRVS